MNFAFDIDGTITAAPEALGAIMRALIAAGHGVYVLSGTGEAEATPMHYHDRVRQLADLGIGAGSFHGLHIVAPLTEGWDSKARWCVENEVVFLLEDSMEYVTPALDQGVFCALVV